LYKLSSMRTCCRSTALLLSLAWIATACGSSVASPTAAGTSLRDEVDRLVTPGIQSGRWASLVGGVYDRGPRDGFGYGHARASGGAPDGQTLYEIGSITKTFTAALLSGLVREGAVALDDPVQARLPRGATVPTYQNASITLQQLSSHVSGLPRLPDNLDDAPGFDPSDPYAHYGPDLLFD